MRYILTLWAVPLIIFWGWYYLSLNDINFGYLMLSRQVHDLAFQMYGDILGIDPATIPGLVMRACIFDTMIIGAIWAFRRRREISRWWRERRAAGASETSTGGREADPVLPAE
jgi:hypothetical protein